MTRNNSHGNAPGRVLKNGLVKGMPDIRRVLVTVSFGEERRAEIEEIFAGAECVFLKHTQKAAVAEAIRDVDVAFVSPWVDRRLLATPGLKWVHIDQSIMDRVAEPSLFEREQIVTGSSGRSDQVMAEHALFLMLAGAFRAPLVERARRRRAFAIEGYNTLQGLSGRSVSIVGMGHTGRALAERCVSLGMNVRGYGRSVGQGPAGVRMFWKDAGDDLERAIEDADYLVLCASLNDSSHHMIGDAQFRALARDAVLVNVGRAHLLDQEALLRALRSGALAFAGLNATHPQPLPVFHPLARLPNVMITPSVSIHVPNRAGRSLDIVRRNAMAYREGKPMENALRPQDVYTKRPHIRRTRIEGALGRAWRRWAMPGV